jgi:hypothetical protein
MDAEKTASFFWRKFLQKFHRKNVSLYYFY